VLRSFINKFHECLFGGLIFVGALSGVSVSASSQITFSQLGSSLCTALMMMTGASHQADEAYIKLFLFLLDQNALNENGVRALLARSAAANPLDEKSAVLSELQNRSFRFTFEKILKTGGIDWENIKTRLSPHVDAYFQRSEVRGKVEKETQGLFFPALKQEFGDLRANTRHLNTRDGKTLIFLIARPKFEITEIPTGIKHTLMDFPESGINGFSFDLIQMGDGRVFAYFFDGNEKLTLFDVFGKNKWELSTKTEFDEKGTSFRKASITIKDTGGKTPQLIIHFEKAFSMDYVAIVDFADRKNEILKISPPGILDSFKTETGQKFEIKQQKPGEVTLKEWLGPFQKTFSLPYPSMLQDRERSRFFKTKGGDFLRVSNEVDGLHFSNLTQGIHKKFPSPFVPNFSGPNLFYEAPTGELFFSAQGSFNGKPMTWVYELTKDGYWQIAMPDLQTRNYRFFTLKTGRTVMIFAHMSFNFTNHGITIFDLKSEEMTLLDTNSLKTADLLNMLETPEGWWQAVMSGPKGPNLLIQLFGPAPKDEL
jgi:hypothetical protein